MPIKWSYYPGCTLKTTATNFDRTARAMAAALEIDLVEIERWYCCGTVYSLASDDVIRILAPIRNLVRTREQGNTTLITLCSMCYNTLVRANELFHTDADRREKIIAIMDRETQYDGEAEVKHFITALDEEVGFDAVAERVTNPLTGLKLAPYYGCLLVRPREAAIDDPEQPQIIQRLIGALGADAVETPFATECCGAFQTVDNKPLVAKRGYAIIQAARARGAAAIVTSCPLCHFNLDTRQREIQALYKGFEPMPILYFTQVGALALGVPTPTCGFDQHYIDPRPLLIEKGLIEDEHAPDAQEPPKTGAGPEAEADTTGAAVGLAAENGGDA